MISIEQFVEYALNVLGKDVRLDRNSGQHEVVTISVDKSLFVVAGPGSGKTTAITLKVLKMIFVDEVSPDNIFLTTFTRKAASELTSRVMGWGDQLRHHLLSVKELTQFKHNLMNLDFTKVYVGTIDSLAQDILGEYRLPGDIEPVIIEDFATKLLMLKYGLIENGRFRSRSLTNLLSRIQNRTSNWISTREMTKLVSAIKDRVYTDIIDVNGFRNSHDREFIRLSEALDAYYRELNSRNLFDYGKLETEFLRQLQSGQLNEFLQKIKCVLVDEYQDTNLLQERIYFELAKGSIANGGGITVVGDDDQSLYRFRGATVELFTSFEDRLTRNCGATPIRVNLFANYRSTREIRDFVNRYITLDPDFQTTRVPGKQLTGPPPEVENVRTEKEISPKVLCLLRRDVETLGLDLSRFITSILQGDGYRLPDGSILQRDLANGSPSDIAMLTYSPSEYSSTGRERLPLLLKRRLEGLPNPINVFNPRGVELSEVMAISELCGLILECIDPDNIVQNNINNLPQDVPDTLNNWRIRARNFLFTNGGVAVKRRTLENYVSEAKNLVRNNTKYPGTRNIDLTRLIYDLIAWMPSLHNDIVGLAYLELVTRAIEQSSIIEPLTGTVATNIPRLRELSVTDVIWNIMVPIATGTVDLNEDLFETLPPDRLNIMSFHQAKGLEFPLVIVDVGSDFRTNHHWQAFRRYPTNGGETGQIEDFIRQFSPLGPPQRNALDRAFDDLIRDYFVAYSRPQDCLLLVGLTTVNQDRIANVATGWLRRNRRNRWPEISSEILFI